MSKELETMPLLEFRSAVSGLWYGNPKAAGTVDAVRLFTGAELPFLYELPSNAEEPISSSQQPPAGQVIEAGKAMRLALSQQAVYDKAEGRHAFARSRYELVDAWDAAVASAPRWIPEGWALVPKIATPDMLRNAGFRASAEGASDTGQNTWEWFVNSAPSPPTE